MAVGNFERNLDEGEYDRKIIIGYFFVREMEGCEMRAKGCGDWLRRGNFNSEIWFMEIFLINGKEKEKFEEMIIIREGDKIVIIV